MKAVKAKAQTTTDSVQRQIDRILEQNPDVDLTKAVVDEAHENLDLSGIGALDDLADRLFNLRLEQLQLDLTEQERIDLYLKLGIDFSAVVDIEITSTYTMKEISELPKTDLLALLDEVREEAEADKGAKKDRKDQLVS